MSSEPTPILTVEEKNFITNQEDRTVGGVVKFVDLFAGLGGVRLGFEHAFNTAGFRTECVLTSEIKPYAIKALQENFPEETISGDICCIPSEDIEDFDFLLAGFPCQAFSTAGKGLGFLDTRGTLFFEVERILKDKQPYGFILENVEGLVLHDRENVKDKMGRTLKTILTSLNNLGYQVEWGLLESQHFGVPQKRKRIFIVGTKTHPVPLTNFTTHTVPLADILEHGKPVSDTPFTRTLLSHYTPKELYGKGVNDKRGGVNNIHSWDINLKGALTKDQKHLMSLLFKERRRKRWAEEIGVVWADGMPLTTEQIATFYPHKNLQHLLDDLTHKKYLVKEHPKNLLPEPSPTGGVRYVKKPDVTKPAGYNIVTGRLSYEFTKILDPESFAPTLVATDVPRIGVVDGEGIRQLTIREGLRMFGYPETYTLSEFNDSKKGLAEAFDLLGNTVAVPVVRAVAERLCEVYKNTFEMG